MVTDKIDTSKEAAMSDLLRRLDIPMPPEADDDGYFTVPAWVIELTAEAAARIRALDAQLAEAHAALDCGVEGAGFWRFWQKKATEYATRVVDAEARAARAEGILAGMGVTALVEAAEYALRAADHLRETPHYPCDDVYMMVKETAAVKSLSDARAVLAALAAFKGDTTHGD